jgi:hypothetical protein
MERSSGWNLQSCASGAKICMMLELGTIRKVDQKYLESCKICCWRSMEKFGRTDRARNEEVLHKTKDEKNILRAVKSRKAN